MANFQSLPDPSSPTTNKSYLANMYDFVSLILKIEDILPLEKLTYDKHQKYEKLWLIWSPTWEYLEIS